MKNVITAIFAVLLAGWSLPAEAASVINVGTHYLLPDTPGQRVDIYIDDPDGLSDVAGLDLNVQIGDGGRMFGGSPAPTIESIDPVHGTIFNDNNDGGSQDTFTFPQIVLRSVVTRDNTTVVPQGMLCSIQVDTTGFDTVGQSWSLNLSNTLAGPTVLLDQAGNVLPAEIFDGAIVLGNPPLLLETNPAEAVDFGAVLVGQTGQQNVQATNAGTEGNVLSGTFPAVTGEFGPGSTRGFLLNQGESADRLYTYAPASRGVDQQDMTITSDGGNKTLVLSGQGVAPQQDLATDTPAVLVGYAGAVGVDVINVGDGNLSGLGAVSNLTGQLGAGIGTFTRQGDGTVDLQDGQSETVNYTFAPTQRGFYQRTLTAEFDNGSRDGRNQAHQQQYAVQGYGVAPVSSVDDTGANIGLTRIGTTRTGTVRVSNTGDGNRSGLGAISNLSGTIGGTSGVFVGPGGEFSLTDGSTRSYQYSFTPTAHRVEAKPLTILFDNGSPDGRNRSHHDDLMLVATGVGPVFQSNIVPGNVLSFVGPNGPLTRTLGITNATEDNGGIEYIGLTLWYAFQGPGAQYFQITGLNQGQVLNKGDLLDIDIHFVPPTGDEGELLWPGNTRATLWLYTDQNAAFGATGDAFRWELDFQSESEIPEPMTLGLVGLGLVSLGAQRRWRK